MKALKILVSLSLFMVLTTTKGEEKTDVVARQDGSMWEYTKERPLVNINEKAREMLRWNDNGQISLPLTVDNRQRTTDNSRLTTDN